MSLLDCVPEELKRRPQWLPFHEEDTGELKPDGSPRILKIPYDPRNRCKARYNDPKVWVELPQAEQAVNQSKVTADFYAGVGFVLSADDPYTVIDLDRCFDALGNLSAEAQSIVERLPTYWEYSGSGRGLHGWMRAVKPNESCRVKGNECYDKTRFMTVSGRPYGEPLPIAYCQAELDALFAEEVPRNSTQPATLPSAQSAPLDL